MKTLHKMRHVPLLLTLVVAVLLAVPAPALAAQPTVNLGTTSSFAVLAASTLVTASNSSVNLINGARYCRIFWKVGSSATLGTNSHFVGHIFALTSITANTGATVQGQLLARNGAVTLDTNTITNGICATVTTTSSTTSTTSPGSTSSTTSTTGSTSTTSTTSPGSTSSTTSTTGSSSTTSTTGSTSTTSTTGSTSSTTSST